MTMPYSPGRALFEGNGTATDFPFSFKVWGTEQLTVTLTGPDGNSRPASGWTACWPSRRGILPRRSGIRLCWSSFTPPGSAYRS